MDGHLKTAAVDEIAKDELAIYLENESRLYSQKKAILLNMSRKIRSGKYDANLAWKAWSHWVDTGAKLYMREFGDDSDTVFSKETRDSLAKDLAKEYKAKIDNGEYDMLKSAGASDQGSNNEAGHLRLASEEVPLVNEGLVHLVAAKVDDALAAVCASQKKGSEIARKDLHTISTKLAGIVKQANMGDPSLRPQFIDLASKADKVKEFFSA